MFTFPREWHRDVHDIQAEPLRAGDAGLSDGSLWVWGTNVDLGLGTVNGESFVGTLRTLEPGWHR